MFDGVYYQVHCFCFEEKLFFWCPCMAIDLLPDIILLTQSYWNPFKCHEDVLYLQPLIPPKRLDIFSP